MWWDNKQKCPDIMKITNFWWKSAITRNQGVYHMKLTTGEANSNWKKMISFRSFLKVTSAIKQKYCWENHYLYSQSLLFIIKAWKEKNKKKYSYFYFTLLLTLVGWLHFWFVFNSYLSERLQKYNDWDVDMSIRQNSENLFMCMISLYTIILKLV